MDCSLIVGMETLVAVAHHRNQHKYYGRNRNHGSSKFGSFGSPPSANFRAINCRTFQSGEGLLPNPFNDFSYAAPLAEKTFSPSHSPKTPSPLNEYPENPTSKRIVKSRSVPVPIKFKLKSNEGGFLFSERWAGPAYSNSPPPSSLPIPKFSIRPKRTVSLDLPSMSSEFDLHPIAKSAPASPTRERSPSPVDLFGGADDPTKTLRRILNLDITDE